MTKSGFKNEKGVIFYSLTPLNWQWVFSPQQWCEIFKSILITNPIKLAVLHLNSLHELTGIEMHFDQCVFSC